MSKWARWGAWGGALFRAYRRRGKEEKMGMLIERTYWIEKVGGRRRKERLSVYSC
jgi:hypothetical protein